MKTYPVVIGIARFSNKILLLKRNSNRAASPNKWQPISGSIREKESAEKAVLRETREETGLEGKIIKAGRVFEVTDDWGRWIAIPFLISVNSDKVIIDAKEHSEFRWIKPEEINKFDCIAGTKEDLESMGLL